MTKGQLISGTIKNIQKYGVFVRIDGAMISGLCHRSNIDDPPADLATVYSIGQPVQAVVSSIEPAKNKISFSLKVADLDQAGASAEHAESSSLSRRIKQLEHLETAQDLEDSDDAGDDASGGSDEDDDADDLDIVLDEAAQSSLEDDEDNEDVSHRQKRIYLSSPQSAGMQPPLLIPNKRMMRRTT